MEVLTGKVITKTEPTEKAPDADVELFTNPVTVHRRRLSFGAVPVIQLLLTVICGAILWYLQSGDGEMQAAAEEIVRKLSGA